MTIANELRKKGYEPERQETTAEGYTELWINQEEGMAVQIEQYPI